MSAWIVRRDAAAIRAETDRTDPTSPLAGRRLAVKDNVDVAGLPTTAGCPAFAYEPAESAPVVQRLVAAGAIVVGKTALDQFATGLSGTRSPLGALESPLAPGHVSGGSSSGSTVAVAVGDADIALGTDTAGSGRVPAAFCGIVGLKPTPGWLSTRGVVPACRSLDCVSVFAPDVATAAVAVDAAGGFDPADPWSRPVPNEAKGGRAPVRRVGVDRALVARWAEPAVLAAFDTVVARLAGLGFDVVPVDLDAYAAAGELLYGGALVAERYAAVGRFVDEHPGDIDPSVRAIIGAAAKVSAHELADDQHRARELARRAGGTWDRVDAVLLPTTPSHPTVAALRADPIGANLALGRFTSGCNVVGWCAATVPAGCRPDGLPFGVTLMAPPWHDRPLWAAAATIAGQPAPAPGPAATPTVALAVFGAHLSGQPLNGQLTSRGARLATRTSTAPCYRMALLDTTPAKPGVTRVPTGGAALDVEVWDLEEGPFGAFVAEIPPPLVIGTVELADGSTVKGFLCEPHALADAVDITHHGGWRGWLARAT